MIVGIAAPLSDQLALRLTLAGMSLKINKSSLILACYFHLLVLSMKRCHFMGTSFIQ